MSNRLTFSLTSLIVMVIAGLVLPPSAIVYADGTLTPGSITPSDLTGSDAWKVGTEYTGTTGTNDEITLPVATLSGQGTNHEHDITYTLTNQAILTSAGLTVTLPSGTDNGKISGTPTQHLANTQFTLEASINNHAPARVVFALEIQALPAFPNPLFGQDDLGVDIPSDKVYKTNSTVNLHLPTATDADDTNLTYSISADSNGDGTFAAAIFAGFLDQTNLPGLTWAPATRQIIGVPTAETANPITFVYRAEDNDGNTADVTFTIKITDSDKPNFGLVTAIDDIELEVGDRHFPATRLPIATDPDGDTVTHSLTVLNADGAVTSVVVPNTALASGLTFDLLSEDFYFIQGTATTAGEVSYAWVASDGDSSTDNASLPFSIIITQPEVPVALSTTIADQGYTVGMAITDLVLPEADPNTGIGNLTYSLTPAEPAGLTFTAATRTLSGTPTAEMAATPYTYTVTDSATPRANTASQTFTITVNLEVPVALSTTIADQAYTVDTAITDLVLPEADPNTGVGNLTYSLTPAEPAGLTFTAATRTLSGTPTAEMAATPYTYTVTDSATPRANTASQTFTITVNSANDPPTVTITTEAPPESQMGSFSVNYTTEDPNSDPVTVTAIRTVEPNTPETRRYYSVTPASGPESGVFTIMQTEADEDNQFIPAATVTLRLTPNDGFVNGAPGLISVIFKENTYAPDNEAPTVVGTLTPIDKTDLLLTCDFSEEMDISTLELSRATTPSPGLGPTLIIQIGEWIQDSADDTIYTTTVRVVGGHWASESRAGGADVLLKQHAADRAGNLIVDDEGVNGDILFTYIPVRPNPMIRSNPEPISDQDGSTITVTFSKDITDALVEDDVDIENPDSTTNGWGIVAGTFAFDANTDTATFRVERKSDIGQTRLRVLVDPDAVVDMYGNTNTSESATFTIGNVLEIPATIADQTFPVDTPITPLALPLATGGTPPYTYTLEPVPPGLHFNPFLLNLTGTPTTVGTTNLTYTATDTAGASGTLTFTITVTGTGPGPGPGPGGPGALDIDNDGEVTVIDLAIVALFYGTRVPVGLRIPADVNADGTVNLLDLTAVAQGIDAANSGIQGLSLQAVEEVVAAAVEQAAELEAVAEAPIGFSHRDGALPPRNVLSGGIAYSNVANALADARYLAVGNVLSAFLDMLSEIVAIPEASALLPNYPNPFNPETWIPYHLAKDAEVTLTVYNIRGEVVRTLDVGHQPAGIYRSRGRATYWDGKNQIGEKVASGLYFYTLTAGDFTATRKMLIAK